MTVCNLSRPDRIDWPDSWEDIEALRYDVSSRLPHSYRPMMDICLAAHLLLTPYPRRDNRSVRKFVDILDPDLLPTAVFEENSPWVLIPVLVVSDTLEPAIHTFLVGARPGKIDTQWPAWMADHLDSSACVAISDAFTAACSLSGVRRGLFVFPLLPPGAVWKIAGRSLALPLALAGLSVLTGDALTPDMTATGDLSGGGPHFPIEAVSHIMAKAEAACRRESRILLIPKTVPPPAEAAPGMVIQPVHDLREAWLWGRMFAPGREQQIERLKHIISASDASLLIDNCLNIDRELLEWLIGSEHGKPLASSILNDSTLIKSLVEKLEKCLEPADRDLKQAAAVAGLLFEPHGWQVMKEKTPLQAFKWATLNVKRLNHSGEIEAAHKWHLAAEALRPMMCENYPDEYFEFINNLFVSGHNIYSFDPQPRTEFMEALTDAGQQKRGINAVQGRMYGTLAQNYGFCGPKYLPDVIENIRLAHKKFGNGAPDFYQDWLRGFPCLVYAYLDAGHHTDARLALMTYLLTDSFETIRPWERLQRYEHQALVRYLADTNAVSGDAIENRLAASLVENLKDAIFTEEHPYQLITYNLGRLAGKTQSPALARSYFLKSLTICENSDETIRVMGLLPLSELHRAGCLEQCHEASAAAIKELIASSRYLSKTHFAPLMAGSILGMLEKVKENPAQFFPFSYR
jgi:hypothetical protein